MTSDLFATRRWRTNPVTEEEMMDCYQFGKKDAEAMPDETLDAVARTKADPNRSRREDALVAEIERLREEIAQLKADALDERVQAGWRDL